jgi:hypothetical protein
MALSHQQRDQIERRIRAAIDRLLAGQIPPGGACDVKTLAREAGISCASLYRTWGHLKDEFEQRRAAAWPPDISPIPARPGSHGCGTSTSGSPANSPARTPSSTSSRSVTSCCCPYWQPKTTSSSASGAS